jgi:hypothetical protein
VSNAYGVLSRWRWPASSTWWGAGGIARERYLKFVETIDIDRRLRELESKTDQFRLRA